MTNDEKKRLVSILTDVAFVRGCVNDIIKVDPGSWHDRKRLYERLFKIEELLGEAQDKLLTLMTGSDAMCHDIGDRGNFRCSSCLTEWQDANNHDFRYCPSCGAKVTET
jgi:hypothetical protein